MNFPLRWGIVTASPIASDWIKSLQDVPGASVTAVWARDLAKGKAYAEAHGIAKAHASLDDLCSDPNVDIIYIASKTWDHHWQALKVIQAGKHLLIEKPFTDTAEQAKEVYAAADKAGVTCFEGMWTRFFPAYEHARAAIEGGMIGKVVMVQADYPDRVYALTPAPFAFGTDEMPLVAAAGRKVRPQKGVPGEPFSGHGSTPSAAVLQYSKQKAIASIVFSAGRFTEITHFTGTQGRITIETPSHHPSALTIYSGFPKRKGTRKPPLEMGPNGWEGDWEDFALRKQGDNPSAGPFGYVERFDYPLPTPEPRARGQPAGSRWTGEKLIKYKGWNWHGGNQHGFMYQAQAVHRCMAAGLKEFPQFTRKESIQVCTIIDEINKQCAEKGF